MADDKQDLRAPVNLLDPLNVSRETVALRGLQRAVDRMRQLEAELDAAMTLLEEAHTSCREEGIDTSVRFGKVMESAWAAWRNKGMAER